MYVADVVSEDHRASDFRQSRAGEGGWGLLKLEIVTAEVMFDISLDGCDTIEIDVYRACILSEWTDGQIARDNLTTLS